MEEENVPPPQSTLFGNTEFAGEEQKRIANVLRQKLGKENLSVRPGPGGRKLTYIESCRAIELANYSFGFNGWSCRILQCKEEYVRMMYIFIVS